MSQEPMDFEKSNMENLQTWRKVCRLILFSSAGLAVVLLFLALVFF